MKKDLDYLDHILDCLALIERFTVEGKEAFFRDRKTQSAVLRELQTLAESTQRLSPSLKNQHPEIPWTNIAGFRNVLAHDYLGINLERVWDIVERDLPPLQAATKAMRRESGKKE